jgi:anti-sigma factor RsiW
MSAGDCRTIRKRLGAFVDGELSGGDRLMVTRHLRDCIPCEREADDIRDLGAALRAEAPVTDASGGRGLAAGVVSRLVAEQSQSWRTRLQPLFEDWHWVMIGTGSVLGTVACTLLVASVLLFGPRPQRAGSLASLLANVDESAGTLFVVASPAGDNKTSMFMQFDGAGATSTDAGPTMVPSTIGIADEAALTSSMAEMVTRGGKVIELSAMPLPQRQQIEALLDDIRSRHLADPHSTTGPVTVHNLWLVAQTSVSAKAL